MPNLLLLCLICFCYLKTGYCCVYKSKLSASQLHDNLKWAEQFGGLQTAHTSATEAQRPGNEQNGQSRASHMLPYHKHCSQCYVETMI